MQKSQGLALSCGRVRWSNSFSGFGARCVEPCGLRSEVIFLLQVTHEDPRGPPGLTALRAATNHQPKPLTLTLTIGAHA